jgi:hypothetical protein
MATQLSPYGLPKDDTTVLSRVNAIASDDSNLNKMASVEALKGMNRRGLLNSTQSIGAAQDAVLRNALPIASQDAAQAYGASESGLDRQQQLDVQNQNLWQGGQLQLDRQQQLTVQNRQNTFAAGQNQLDRALQQRIASWNLSSSDRNAASSLLSNMEARIRELGELDPRQHRVVGRRSQRPANLGDDAAPEAAQSRRAALQHQAEVLMLRAALFSDIPGMERLLQRAYDRSRYAAMGSSRSILRPCAGCW